MKVKNVIIIISSLITFNAYATQVDDMLQREEAIAEKICKNIQEDQEWVNTLELITNINSVHQLYPNVSNKDGEFVLTNSHAGKVSELGQKYVINFISNKYKNESNTDKEVFEEGLVNTRVLRVLNKCGDVLREQDLILFQPVLTNYKGTKTEEEAYNNVKQKASCVGEYDNKIKQAYDNWYKNRDSSMAKYNYVSSTKSSCYTTAFRMSSAIVFPFHHLVEGQYNDFYSHPRTTDINNTLKNYYQEKLAGLDKFKANVKTKAVEKTNAENRLNEIKSGNISTAKSCAEIGQVYLSQEDSLIVAGHKVSKNSQAILRSPDNKTYGAAVTVLGVEDGTVFTYDVNAINNTEYSVILKTNKNTRWFRDNVSNGKTVYYVGKYVSNGSFEINQGNTTKKVNARVIDLICATSM